METRTRRRTHWPIGVATLVVALAALALPSAALAAYLPWTAQTSGTTQSLYGVSFASDTVGWAAGAGGTLLRTTDGGNTWKAQSSKTTQTLYAIAFTDASNGWAVGGRGMIVHTVNGGTTWTAQTSGTTQALYGVAFASADAGWAVGGRGTLLRTTNGGATWTAVPISSRDTLSGVACADRNSIWVSGGRGVVRHSTDGGATWKVQYPGGKTTFNAVACTSTTAVWVTGNGGAVRKSTNGGASWISQSTGTGQTLYAIAAIDGSRVRVAGAGGAVRLTVNGGTSWAGEATGKTQALYGIAWRGTRGWIVGGGGTILSYVPDTAVPATTAAGLQADDHSGWANAAVTVTLTATDVGTAGVAATLYTVDGGLQKTYTAPFSVSGQGNHPVTYWSVDAAGNTEGVKNGYVNIDTTPPTVDSDADAAWHTTDVTVHLSAMDGGGSGVAATQYRTAGSTDWTTATGDQFVIPATSTQGPHTYDIRSLDAAGNASATGTCTVKIDATAPVTTATGLGEDILSAWSSTVRTVTLSAADGAGSGVTTVHYTVDGGAAQTYAEAFTVSGAGRHPVTYWSTDAAGNVEALHTGWVNISDPYAQADGLAPDMESHWHNGAVTVTITAHGAPGPLALHYTLDGVAQPEAGSQASFQVSGVGHHTVVFYATNGNNDASPTQTGYVNIDELAPQTALRVGAPRGWVNHAVRLEFVADDDHAGVAATYSSLDGGNAVAGTALQVPAPADHSGDRAHTITFWSTDVAGNVETPRLVTVRIDTRKPTTKAPYSAVATRGQTARLRYVVKDEAPCAGTAAAKIVIKNARGKAVKTLKVRKVKTGLAATVKFRCKLGKGKYKFFVYATDAAGNPQSKIAYNRLTVR